MKRVVLIFPDTASITSILLMYKIAGAQVDTLDHSLTGILSNEQIEAACHRFKAVVKLSYTIQ